MGQKERDRLKVLHEASKGQITQKQAGEQLGLGEQQVRRLVGRLQAVGDAAVIHGAKPRVESPDRWGSRAARRERA